MLKDTSQDLWKYKIATYNQKLHQASICPANHTVEYANGWYYYDGEPKQRPDVTRKAKELQTNPNVVVRFQSAYNSYVLVPFDPTSGFTERGEVHV